MINVKIKYSSRDESELQKRREELSEMDEKDLFVETLLAIEAIRESLERIPEGLEDNLSNIQYSLDEDLPGKMQELAERIEGLEEKL